MIVLFAYFYSQLQINPYQIAENFQESGTYINGIKPGEETAKYISKVLTRITFVGSISLLLIALLPFILSLTNAVPASLSLGWTGLIIVVDVSLEDNNQINGILDGNGFVESEL